MAQVSSGSFVTNASEGRSLTFSWSVDSSSITENYTKIYWAVKGSGSYTGYVYAGDFKFVIDGETVYESNSRIQLWQGTVVASGYKIIYHDAYGNKTFSASVQSSIYEYAIDNTGSGSWELPTIPRYATVSLSLNSKTETSITINWSSDSLIDCMWVSTDGGASFGTGIYKEATSGSYTISGLNADTTYKIRIQVRRKDSQLGTNSDILSVKTESYPYCSKSNDFIIGDSLNLTLHNPLKRPCDIYLELADGTVDKLATGWDDTSFSVKYTGSAKDILYKSIPNATSGIYKIRVVCGDVTKIRDNENTYKVRGDECPTINSVTYYDNNSKTVALTGNDQHIIQNYSTLNVAIDPVTPNNGAGGISKVVIECGVLKIEADSNSVDFTKAFSFGFSSIDSARDVDLKVTAIDTRGLTATKTVKVTMIAHSPPTAKVTLERLNNYEDETYLTVDGSVSSLNGKNTIKIFYRHTDANGKYGVLVETNDRQKNTLSLDKNYSYTFEVRVTDALGSGFIGKYILDKGKFPLFVDTVKNAVGINEFPDEGEALRVKDGVAHFEDGIKIDGSVVADYIVEYGTVGNWHYEKRASGIAECWAYHEYSNVTFTAERDGAYCSNGVYEGELEATLPVTFADIYPSIQGNANNLFIVGSSWISGNKLFTSIYSLQKNTTPQKVDVRWHIKGRWK